jgi:hypothetical protein
MGLPEKLCLWCKHFYFQQEIPDWSEYTPGEGANIGCGLHNFHIDVDEDTTNTYRKKLLTAITCLDYKFDTELLKEDDEEIE